MPPKNTSPSILRQAIDSLRPLLKQVAWIGVAINLLALAPTIYMLEVYDRVVNSRNSTTLLMLTVLVLGMYLLMEVLEWVRGRMLHQGGLVLEKQVGERVFNAAFEANMRRIPGAQQVLNDQRSLREFISSPAVTAMMDAPMSLFYLLLIFLINPWLGVFSVSIALAQVLVAYLTEKTTRLPLMEANRAAIAAQTHAAQSLRNAQVIEAMGMLDHLHKRWMAKQQHFLNQQAIASDQAGGKAAFSKVLQNVASSGLLGLSCWFLLEGTLSGGGAMMIIPGILGAKMLQPLVQLVSQWKSVVSVRDAYQRLDGLLLQLPERSMGMSLPPPQGQLLVEGVIAGAPNSQVSILRGVSFGLPAGKALVVIGPSAAGKSTLARLLVGIWPALSGKVRLDGADVYAWDKAELGPHVGYLPQNIELFDGTLAENIARFGEVNQAQVETAARAIDLHETIMALPAGYDTRIGDDGCFLSGGQRQRVGMARAIYGNPSYVVLDEPNSSLDEAGEKSLVHTLQELKEKGTTLVIITHRTSILPVADAILLLRDGQVAAFGPRDEVLAALQKAQQPASASTPPEAIAAPSMKPSA